MAATTSTCTVPIVHATPATAAQDHRQDARKRQQQHGRDEEPGGHRDPVGTGEGGGGPEAQHHCEHGPPGRGQGRTGCRSRPVPKAQGVLAKVGHHDAARRALGWLYEHGGEVYLYAGGAVWVAAAWGFAGTTLFLVAGDRVGWDLDTTTLATSDYGPSSGTAAVAATIVVLMRHLLVTVAFVAVLLIGSALHHQVADLEHIISFGTVLLIALVVRTGQRGRGRDDTGQGDPMPPRPRPRRGAS